MSTSLVTKPHRLVDALRARNDVLCTTAADRIDAQRERLSECSRGVTRLQADLAKAEAATRDMRREIDALRVEIVALRSGPAGRTS